MSEQELKPCPFCGCNVSISNQEFEFEEDDEELFWIECTECEDISVKTLCLTDKERVIESWNTRVGEVSDD